MPASVSASVPLSAPSKDLSQDSYGLSSQARTTRDPKGKGRGSDRPRGEGRESGRQTEQNRSKTTKPKRGRDRGAEPDRQKRPKTKQTERDYRMKLCWESRWITVGKSGHRPTNTEPLFNAGTMKRRSSPRCTEGRQNAETQGTCLPIRTLCESTPVKATRATDATSDGPLTSECL